MPCGWQAATTLDAQRDETQRLADQRAGSRAECGRVWQAQELDDLKNAIKDDYGRSRSI